MWRRAVPTGQLAARSGEGSVVTVEIGRVGAEREAPGPEDLGRVENIEVSQCRHHRLNAVRRRGHAGMPQRAGKAENDFGYIPLTVGHRSNSASTVLRARTASSWYFNPAPSVAAARSGSSERAPNRCKAWAQSIDSATPAA